jgi:hypothetical protein
VVSCGPSWTLPPRLRSRAEGGGPEPVIPERGGQPRASAGERRDGQGGVLGGEAARVLVGGGEPGRPLRPQAGPHVPKAAGEEALIRDGAPPPWEIPRNAVSRTGDVWRAGMQAWM